MDGVGDKDGGRWKRFHPEVETAAVGGYGGYGRRERGIFLSCICNWVIGSRLENEGVVYTIRNEIGKGGGCFDEVLNWKGSWNARP